MVFPCKNPFFKAFRISMDFDIFRYFWAHFGRWIQPPGLFAPASNHPWQFPSPFLYSLMVLGGIIEAEKCSRPAPEGKRNFRCIVDIIRWSPIFQVQENVPRKNHYFESSSNFSSSCKRAILSPMFIASSPFGLCPNCAQNMSEISKRI